MMLTAFFLVQFAVGFLNHRQYRKTQVPSKYNVYHVWFGRLLILLAIMNGFLYVLSSSIYDDFVLTSDTAALRLLLTDDTAWFWLALSSRSA
jgi:hypothetical protein